MKAILQKAYGSPDVFELGEIDPPTASAGQVRVRVHAAGVDRGVWHLMAGLPYLLRVMGFGLRSPKQRVPGMDVAGRIEAVGPGVTQFQPGDEVFGEVEGSYAEVACAPADKIALKPTNLTFEQAAAVPVSALTALQALRDAAKVQAGQHVLVIGASGGVGTYAVQIAKAFGAEVTGVASAAKADLVRSIGADHVIDYTREDVTASQQRFDAIIDIGGNRALMKLCRILTPRGTLVIVGGEAGGRWLGGVGRLLRAMVLSPMVSQQLRPMLAVARRDDLLALKELIEGGKVKPVIDKVYPLSQAAEALRRLESGSARGKIVIAVPA